MYAKGRRQIRRSNIKRLPLQVVSLASLLCLLFVVYSGFQPTRLSGGDNIDALSGGEIFDRFWDPRLFNGVVVGYDGFIKWRYNDTGVPAEVPLVFEHTAVQTQLQAAFDNWDAVDDTFPGDPMVPIVSFDGAATATDAFALDGENAITWRSDPGSGILAITPFWYLTAPTALEGAGLPIGGGAHIPFPGNVGDIQPKGALIDAGMEFNSAFAWSTAAGPELFRYDVQSIAIHEAGHFVALSHSTAGLSDGPNALSATMIPFGIDNDIEVRSLQPGFPFWPSWSVYDSRLPAAMQRFSHCCQVRYSFRCRSGLRMLADHGVPAKPEGPLATPLPRRPSATRVRWLFRAVDVTLRAQVAPKSAAACRRTTSGSDAPPQAATNNIARASRAVRPSSSADAASSSAASF